MYHVGSLGSPSANPSVPLQDIAVTYFLTVHAPSSQFWYIQHVLSQDDLTTVTDVHNIIDRKVNSPLPIATLACALAVLSQTDPTYRLAIVSPLAYNVYNAAIQTLNIALSSHTTAKLDSTLMSVLLLALFEAVISHGHIKYSSWATHTRGAVALLNLRGAQQCRTNVGRELFLHAKGNIQGSCAQTGTSVHRELRGIQDEAISEGWLNVSTDAGLRIGSAIEKLGNLGAQYRARQTTPGCSCSILLKLIGLDREVAEIEAYITDGWEVHTAAEAMGIPIPPLLSTRHSFHCGWGNDSMRPGIVRTWMTILTLRLIINDWLHHSLTKSQEDNSAASCNVQQTGYLGEISKLQMLQTIKTNARNTVRKVLVNLSYFTSSPHLDHSKLTSRYLIWPLSRLAASFDFTTPSERLLVSNYLAKIELCLQISSGQATRIEHEATNSGDQRRIQIYHLC